MIHIYLISFFVIINWSLSTYSCSDKECYLSGIFYERSSHRVDVTAFSFNLTPKSMEGHKIEDFADKGNVTLKVTECVVAEYKMSSSTKRTVASKRRLEDLWDAALAAFPGLILESKKLELGDTKDILEAVDKILKFGRDLETGKVKDCTSATFTVSVETISGSMALTLTLIELQYKGGEADAEYGGFQVQKSEGDIKMDEIYLFITTYNSSRGVGELMRNIIGIQGASFVKNDIGKKMLEKIKSGTSGIGMIVIIGVVVMVAIICVVVVVLKKKTKNSA